MWFGYSLVPRPVCLRVDCLERFPHFTVIAYSRSFDSTCVRVYGCSNYGHRGQKKALSTHYSSSRTEMMSQPGDLLVQNDSVLCCVS